MSSLWLALAVCLCALSSVCGLSLQESRTLDASLGVVQAHATVERLLQEHARSDSGFTRPTTMREVERTQQAVTYAHEQPDGSVHSMTFSLAEEAALVETGAATFARSQAKGACAKPLCKTGGPYQTACEQSVCYPLCLNTMMDIEVMPGGDNIDFLEQLGDAKHQSAIQGVLLGIGCSEMTGCCPKDERLATWTESKLQGAGAFGLPLPYCKHATDRAAACAACQATVTVKSRGAQACDNFYKPAGLEGAAGTFTRAKTPVFNQPHKSFKEKCQAVDAEVSGAIGAMQAAFQGYVCGCLGCCDDQICPYKIAHSNVDEAVTAAAAEAAGGDAAGGDATAAGADGAGADGGAAGAQGGDAAGADAAGAGGTDAAAGGAAGDAGADGAGGSDGGGGDGAGGLPGAGGGAAKGAGGLLGKLEGGLQGKLGGLGDKLKGKLGGLTDKLKSKMGDLQGKLQEKMGALQGKLGGALDKAGLGGLKGQMDGAFSKVNAKMAEGMAKATSKIDEAQEKITGAADQAIHQGEAALGGALGGLGGEDAAPDEAPAEAE